MLSRVGQLDDSEVAEAAQSRGAIAMFRGFDVWDVSALIGTAACVVGIAGGELALLRLLPWGKNWQVGSCF